MPTCQDCGYFQPFDTFPTGRQNGGNCGQYQHYKANGLTEYDLDKLLRTKLGGGYPIFIGAAVRDCKKFKLLVNA